MKTKNHVNILFIGLCLCIAISIQRLSMAAGNILYILSILMFIYVMIGRENIIDKLQNNERDLCKIYCAFLISLIPSLIFSTNFEISFKSFMEMWVYRALPLFIIVLLLRNKILIEKMLIVFFCAEALDCLVAGAQVLLKYSTRGWGFGSNTLNLAGLLSILFPIVVIIALDERISVRLRKVAVIILPALFIGILAGKSRGLWLTLAIVLPVILYRYILINKKNMAITMIIFAAIVAFFSSNVQYMNRLKSTTNITTDISNVDRLIVWRSSYLMIKDHKFTGVGLGNYKSEYEKKYKLKEVTQNMSHSHNNFIQIMAESGIIGALGFLLLTLYMLYSNFINWYKENDPYSLMLFSSWLGFTLFGMIDLIADASAIMKSMWFLTGSILVMKNSKIIEE